MPRTWCRAAPWPLIVAGVVMELGWLLVGGASPRLTESDGFSQAMLQQLPPIWEWAAVLRRTQTPESTSKLILVSGLALACVGFCAALWSLGRGHQARAPATNVWIGVGVTVFGATLLLMPGLLSTDLVMYAVYGREAGVYGLNPYLASPSSIGGDPLLEWASRTPAYATYATPYGPLWTAFTAVLAAATAWLPPLGQTFAYRVIGIGVHGVNALLVARLVRLAAPSADRSLALLLYAWNPLALFELVAGGHNDGVMLSLTLAGLLLVFRGAPLRGSALLAAGALVKWMSGVPLLYATCADMKSVSGWPARVKRLGVVAAVLAAMTLVLSAPWLDARDVRGLQTSLSAGGQRYVNALVDLPTPWLVSHFVDRAGRDLAASEASVRAWTFGLARLALAAYVLFELLRAASGARLILEASVRTLLLALLVAASQVLAWYLTWPLALAAPLGGRNPVTQLAVAYSVLYLPIFYAIHEDMLSTLLVPPLLIAFAIAPLVAVLAVHRTNTPGALVSASQQAAT